MAKSEPPVRWAPRIHPSKLRRLYELDAQGIHRWHWEAARQRPKFGLGRPTGLNLIEGNKQQVLALLDRLTYGEGSSVGTQTNAAWRTHWQEMQERQAASYAAQRAKRVARKRRSEAE